MPKEAKFSKSDTEKLIRLKHDEDMAIKFSRTKNTAVVNFLWGKSQHSSLKNQELSELTVKTSMTN